MTTLRTNENLRTVQQELHATSFHYQVSSCRCKVVTKYFVYFLFFLLAAKKQLSGGRGLLIGNQPK